MLAALIVAETVFAVTQGKIIQLMYIQHRGYPGGPWQYFLDTQYLAVNVVFDATLFVGTFLCDLLVVRWIRSALIGLPRLTEVSSFGAVISYGLSLAAD